MVENGPDHEYLKALDENNDKEYREFKEIDDLSKDLDIIDVPEEKILESLKEKFLFAEKLARIKGAKNVKEAAVDEQVEMIRKYSNLLEEYGIAPNKREAIEQFLPWAKSQLPGWIDYTEGTENER